MIKSYLWERPVIKMSKSVLKQKKKIVKINHNNHNQIFIPNSVMVEWITIMRFNWNLLGYLLLYAN